MAKIWRKVLEAGDLPEGRVASVTCGKQTICMTHHEGEFSALDNKCPHQGGPLGEGSIDNGWLRCPWHGWDFDPKTGNSPGGHDDGVDTYPVEVRDDGIYVEFDEDTTHERTQGDLIAETLVEWGVKWVFGMVGHSNLGAADGIRRAEEASKMRYIGIRHEGAAAFAASAYGKLTRTPAACLTIAGPGATNLLTGLWDAHVDSAPVVALTGQVPTKLIGRGAFQEVDLAQAFGGVATYSATTWPHSDVAELTSLACKHARVKQGVSHLVLPDDVQTMPAGEDAPGSPTGRMAAVKIAPPAEALNAALGRVRAAKRPVIVMGYGARQDAAQVIALAEALNAPVLTTFKSKGIISDHHPLGCGVLGRSGTPVASWFMNESDLLVVFGASFSNHTGIAPSVPIIQVDHNPMQLGRFHGVDVPIWGDIGVTAGRLLDGALVGHTATDQTMEIAQRWTMWRDEKASRRAEDTPHNAIHPAVVFDILSELAPEDAIIAVDVGNNTYSFGRYFESKGQSVLMSGYLGSIGFGYPAAMGAWCATQEPGGPFEGRQVICVSGDGGFGQYMAEYLTSVKYTMNITHILLNNSELAKISKEQRAGEFAVWETSLHNPNFSDYATLCGAQGWHVEDAADLRGAIASALAHEGPSTVEIITDAGAL